MNETELEAIVTAVAPEGVYECWRAEPKYRLNNLAGDAPSWRFVSLDQLEILAFDQCVVFGAAFPGDLDELPAAARRDAVVRQARDVAWAVYRVYVQRAGTDRRLRFARELATAIEDGAGSAGSLLPVILCDADARVVAAAHMLRSLPAIASRESPPPLHPLWP